MCQVRQEPSQSWAAWPLPKLLGPPTMLLLVHFLALLISSRSSPTCSPRGRNWYYTVLCGLGAGGLRNLDWEIFLSKQACHHCKPNA